MKKILSTFLFLLAVVTMHAQTPDANNILYVNASVSGGTGTGNSWVNAIPQVADALKWGKQQNNFTASNPLKIYVAKGTYKPKYTPEDGKNFSANPTNPRDKAFLLVKNVKVYGGFAGTETTLSQRDLTITANKSILSGDLDGNNILDNNNAYHVMISSGAVGNAELNGFTVTGGNANDANATGFFVNGSSAKLTRNYGGGLLSISSSPTFENVIFLRNYAFAGGAMANNETSLPHISHSFFIENTAYNGGAMANSSSSPIILNTVFSANSAVSDGGGMENTALSSPIISNTSFIANVAANGGGIANNFYSSPTITNTSFSGNKAKYGGGVYDDDSSPIITNVSFSGNRADFDGGGMFNIHESSPVITNATFFGNYAGVEGGGMNNGYAHLPVKIRNTIILGNSSGIFNDEPTEEISNSLIQGLTNTADGNMDATGITAETVFTDALTNYNTAPFTGGNLALSASSPVINKGNQTLFNAGKIPDISAVTTDLAGNPRFFDGQIDMGAYEIQTVTVLPVTLISFTATKQTDKAFLQWQTDTEVTNKGFFVSRSSDGFNFEALSAISSKGNNSTYTYVDLNPFSGTNYYRLQQQDLNGKLTDLGVKVLNFDLSTSSVAVYPNPTQEQFAVAYPANTYQTLTVTDFLGKVVKVEKLTSNSTNQLVSLSGLSAGIYFVKLSGTGKSEIVKVIKN